MSLLSSFHAEICDKVVLKTPYLIQVNTRKIQEKFLLVVKSPHTTTRQYYIELLSFNDTRATSTVTSGWPIWCKCEAEFGENFTR